MKKLLLVLISTLLLFTASFAVKAKLITDKRLDEVSGIVASRINPDVYYVQNDSGGKPEVYALNSKGKIIAILNLEGITNRDWEDIAIGPGPDANSSYIYVGEIGDNNAQYDELMLYRFKEPKLNQVPKKARTPITITDIETIRFVFADGAKDCETLFFDSANGDVYLLSKREYKVGVYQIKSPLSTSEVNVASRLLTLDFPLAVAGDIAPDRDKIIIKNYENIFLWKVAQSESIIEAMSKPYQELPYTVEPQGEAICFSIKGESYLTLSEKDPKQKLYLYQYPLGE
jgi:hypothetical protein